MPKYRRPEKLAAMLQPCLKKTDGLILFLDYDGTLRPIAGRPEDATPGPTLKSLLKRLERTHGVVLAIVTGRPVRNIRHFLPLKKTWFVGTHGAQIAKGSGRPRFLVPTRKARQAIRQILKQISPHLDSSFTLEKKDVSLSLHYRLASADSARRLRSLFCRLAAPYVRNHILKLSHGKQVVEAKPAQAHKGLAVDAVRRRAAAVFKNPFCVALGDDVIDEDLFRAVRSRGVSIVVGSGQSRADYRLKDPRQVRTFLTKLTQLQPATKK